MPSNTCNSCGGSYNPGDTVCPDCGAPVGLTVLPKFTNYTPPTPQKAATSWQALSSGPSPDNVSILCPVDYKGQELPSSAILLPTGYFRYTLGRADLKRGIIPQLDLDRLVGSSLLQNDKGEYFVSRQAAIIRRDPATGDVFLQCHISSSSMIYLDRGGAVKPVLPGDEILLAPDDEIIMGKVNRYLKFRVR